MADQVGRKKSYRWVSASQASYDGSEWDSDEDDTGHRGDRKSKSGCFLKRNDTISKLPALPKLNYDGQDDNNPVEEGKGNEVIDETLEEGGPEEKEPEGVRELPELPGDPRVESFAGDDLLENYMGDTVASRMMENSKKDYRPDELQRKKPEPLPLGDRQEDNIPELGLISSRDSSKSSLPRKIPVNEDLDNLMAQISRQMEQQQGVGRHLTKEEDEINTSPIVESGDDQGIDEEEEFGVSKNGYFSNLVQSDKEDDHLADEESPKNYQRNSGLGEYSPENHLERNALSSSLSYSRSSKETGREPVEEYGEEDKNKDTSSLGSSPMVLPEPSSLLSPTKSPSRSLSASPARSSDGSSASIGPSLEDSEDDALSFTESLNYHASTNGGEDAEGFHGSNNNEEEVGESDDESIMRMHKSGYFGKMVKGDDVETIRNGSDDECEQRVTTITSDGNNLRHEDSHRDEMEKEQAFTKTKEESDKEEGQKEIGEGKRSTSGQKSVNLGGWRPDTSAARSGFLQETTKKAPPGYVYDENGELINLTPSSMKPRVVSSYSEVESAWNPFPSDGNDDDDLQTVGDTKTIYDNQTIYNVPGLITNNQNMPPLPNLGNESHFVNQPTGSNSSDPKSLTVSSSIATVSEIDSERDKGPLRSHFHEVLNSSTPNLNTGSDAAKDAKKSSASDPPTPKIPIINEASTVPFLDLNKVISSKSAHFHKIQELEHYYNQLLEHDTGISSWIEASLKATNKPEKDYLFEQYKVSKHVKDAYANADELSKKHTVTNTVASVNQNVSQLKKKVFSHPMKSKGLFASIGKKKV